MPLIELTTFIAAPAERCYSLSMDAEVHISSMAHTSERAIAGRISGMFELGDTVTWQARHLGFTQQLQVKITAVNYPSHFRDEMIRGIFKVMRHDHYFSEKKGIITMRDAFYYESPLGILGKLADALFLRRYMTRLLQQRNAVIKELAEKGQA
jgi:ligand-binding SRPBCC domain-containing protein